MRGTLYSLTPFYRLGWFLKNRPFETDPRRTIRLPVPIISVGNLTTGGTGKTPMVLWLSQWLAGLGERPVILSRGYKAGPDGHNDEYRELQWRIPEVPHLQNRDRIASGRKALEQHQASCLILDDGFQHRQLGRDVNLLLVDATDPFGGEFLLPRGLLREPLESIRRADMVVITRCDQVGANEMDRIRQVLSRHFDGPVLESLVAPGHWMDGAGNQHAMETAQGSRSLAFAGIGNPNSFFQLLEDSQIRPTLHQRYDDHHHYSQADLDSLVALAESHDCQQLLCTMKDLVKIRQLPLPRIPVWALQVDLRITKGQPELEELIAARMGQRRNEISESVRA